MNIKNLKINRNQKRFLSDSLDVQQDNLIKMSFSSEEPYKRYDWRTDSYYYEVISHDDGDMDLTRLNNKAIVLFNHLWDEPIGVIEKAWIEDKRGYALIRLSDVAGKYKTMIEEKILTKVSFGYELGESKYIGDADDGVPILKFKTSPFECSVVTIPADDSVGLNKSRKKDMEVDEEETIDVEVEIEEKEKETTDQEIAPVDKEDKSVEGKFDIQQKNKENINISTNYNNKGKDNMIKEILEMGKRYGEFELANSFATEGKTLEQFQNALLEKKLSKGSDVDAGTQRELDQFSFAGYVEESLEKRIGSNSGLAKELSHDFIARGYKGHGGIILPRDLVNSMRMKSAVRAAGTYAMGTPEAFGNTAYTDRRTQFIDQLYNASIWNLLSTTMPSAEGFGDVTLPIITSKNNVQMLDEGVAASKSRQGSDHLRFTPKTAKASTSYTRETTQRSSLASVDSVIMSGLVKAMLDKRNQQWLNGTGTDGEILGVFNMTGVNAVSVGDFDIKKLVAFETALANANVDVSRCAYVTNSKVTGVLKTTPQFANTGVPLLIGGIANGYQVLVSNEVRSNYATNKSGMAFVNPEDIGVIEWNAVEFRVNPWIEEDGGVRIDAWDTFDMQALRQSSIAVAKDINT